MTSSTSAPIHRSPSTGSMPMRPNPAPASMARMRRGSARENGPGSSAAGSSGRVTCAATAANGTVSHSLAVISCQHKKASRPPVGEEHHPEAGDGHVKPGRRERVDLRVGLLEPGVPDAFPPGEPTRLGQHHRRQVNPQRTPGPGRPGGADRSLPAATAHIQHHLRGADRRRGQQARGVLLAHPLVPGPLRYEVLAFVSVPRLRLRRIRRHDTPRFLLSVDSRNESSRLTLLLLSAGNRRGGRSGMASELDRAAGLLGPLEGRIMRAVWAGQVPEVFTVGDVHALLPGLAYTTVMTTLRRLADKELLAARAAEEMTGRYGEAALAAFAARLAALTPEQRQRLEDLRNQ